MCCCLVDSNINYMDGAAPIDWPCIREWEGTATAMRMSGGEPAIRISLSVSERRLLLESGVLSWGRKSRGLASLLSGSGSALSFRATSMAYAAPQITVGRTHDKTARRPPLIVARSGERPGLSMYR